MRSTQSKPVQIILATYNGGQWLDDLMISLHAQSCDDWELLVRDDGSTDGTVALLEKWYASGTRMSFLPGSGDTNLGAKANCLTLLAASTAPYVIFAGQDDVWFPDRVRDTLVAFRKAEDRLGATMPLVVCSDAEVVDGKLRRIAPSWWRWARIDQHRTKRVIEVAMEGPVLGAAMAVNRAMIDFALPIPIGYHDADSWLALVAVAFGQLIVLDKPMIRYRRHDANASGNPFGGSLLAAIFWTFATPLAPRHRLHKVLLEEAAPQAAAFEKLYHSRLSHSDVVALSALGKLASFGIFGRRWALLKHGLWYASMLKNLGLFILV